MTRRRHREAMWKTEAFVSLTERLRGFEAALHGGRLLELRCGLDFGCGFLLEWFRPSRLVAVDVDSPPSRGMRPIGDRPVAYGVSGSFDAAFLLARHQLKRAVRCLSLPEVARVLSPDGLLVVTTLGPRLWGPRDEEWGTFTDSSAEAWGLLHASLARAGFRIDEEHLGRSRLLVARRAARLAS